MCKRNNSAVFFTCSLIEQLGRDLHKKRGQVVSELGVEKIRTILEYSDVLHCEPLPKVSDDMIAKHKLTAGDYDNVARAKFAVPDVWTIGKVYARLIEDVSDEDNIPETLMEVYTSWIDARLSDYNASFYYEPREYIAECYHQGVVIDI